MLIFIFLNFIVSISAFFVFHVSKKIFRSYFNPVSIFNFIWITLLLNSIPFFTLSTSNYLLIFLGVILFNIFSIITFNMRYKKHNLSYPLILTYVKRHPNTIKKIIVFCLFLRIVQLSSNLIYVYQLGGDISNIFNDSQRLRFQYLSRELTLSDQILNNFLNYFSEIGLLICVIYSSLLSRYKLLIFSVIGSLLFSIFTFSKFSFFIDLIIVIGTYSIINFYKNEVKKKNYSFISNIFKFSLVISLVLILITTISTQRGYENQQTNSQITDNVALFKTVTYFIGPFLSFEKLTNIDFEHSYGRMTFTPIFELLSKNHFSNPVGIIDISFFQTNVYTLLGSLYIDFGYLGILIGLTLISILVTIIYSDLINNRLSLSKISLYCILLSVLTLSFFDFIARQTFFWLFPIFVLFFEKVLYSYFRKEEKKLKV